ncbi:hypothetical protein HPP92_021267 [Vanilla planifolia]|uniref:Uncharacterized protein n=1 Tax=Vanilla planifolia TaxID=51239 RepID=A0A835PVA1_VANPL|nr:hypothetical protein HPP92_021267 [Vanilla planifolia]
MSVIEGDSTHLLHEISLNASIGECSSSAGTKSGVAATVDAEVDEAGTEMVDGADSMLLTNVRTFHVDGAPSPRVSSPMRESSLPRCLVDAGAHAPSATWCLGCCWRGG